MLARRPQQGGRLAGRQQFAITRHHVPSMASNHQKRNRLPCHSTLPADLKKVGSEASKEIGDRFEQRREPDLHRAPSPRQVNRP